MSSKKVKIISDALSLLTIIIVVTVIIITYPWVISAGGIGNIKLYNFNGSRGSVENKIDSLIKNDSLIKFINLKKYIKCMVEQNMKKDSIKIVEFYNITYKKEKHDSIAFMYYKELLEALNAEYFISIYSRDMKYNYAISISNDYHSTTDISITAISKGCDMFLVKEDVDEVYSGYEKNKIINLFENKFINKI